MKIKTYDLVKTLLEENPELRDSDKKLIWKVWDKLECIYEYEYDDKVLDYEHFMKAPSTETIRRCRQSIQEHNPELRGSKWIQKARAEKAEQGGTHIFREIVGVQEKFI